LIARAQDIASARQLFFDVARWFRSRATSRALLRDQRSDNVAA
jgi:hypothetical protein